MRNLLLRSVFSRITFACVACFSASVYAMCELPQNHFENWVHGHPALNPAIWEWRQGRLNHEPYIPPDGPWSFPVVFIQPQSPSAPLRMKVRLTGHNASPGYSSTSNCHGADFSDHRFSVIKPCAGHYPSHIDHAIEGLNPHGWWGWFLGNSNAARIGISLWEAATQPAVDFSAGWVCQGSSYGATGCLLQSMLMRESDPVLHKNLAVVRAENPHTLPVENGLGFKPSVEVAWRYPLSLTDTEYRLQRLDKIDFKKQAMWGNVQHTFYRIIGSPADTAVKFDLTLFDYMDQHRVAGFGTWHNCGHASFPQPSCSADADIMRWNDLYQSDEMDIRADKMLVAFSNSSANHIWCGADTPCAHGHWNLGWAVDMTSVDFSDVTTQLSVPIRYKRGINFGQGVPDQPTQASVDVTVRRPDNFVLAENDQLQWSYDDGAQAGTVTVSKDGEVTISLTDVTSSAAYKVLSITPQPQ